MIRWFVFRWADSVLGHPFCPHPPLSIHIPHLSIHIPPLSIHLQKEELDILRDAISQVTDLFTVCVVGEFNAGKSRFINALLGDR